MAVSRRAVRRLKKRLTYTIDELALALSVHKNTVRTWVKKGLSVIDDRRPSLVKGEDAIRFLCARWATRRSPCRLDELYCFSCRAPRKPAGHMAEIAVGEGGGGMLRALCAVCLSPMNKRVSAAQAAKLAAVVDVQIQHADMRLKGAVVPFEISDSRRKDRTGETQRRKRTR